MSNFNLTNWFRNEYSGRSLSEALIQNVNNLNGTLRHYIDKGDVYLQFIPTEKTLDDFDGDKEKITKVLVDTLSKVSIIGVGMVTTPGVTFRMFQALAKQNINIQVISTSEIKISVLINRKNAMKAVKSLHAEFNLTK